MPVDLSELSLKDLKKLEKEIPKAIERVAERRKQVARIELEARAKELGYSLLELLNVPSRRKGKVVGPKFVHPDNPSTTWSGRGRKPRWYVEALAKGKKPEDLAI